MSARRSGSGGGIRVRVTRQNLNDDFTIMPNELLRGEGIYAGLEPHARCLLGAGLSCRDGWEASMDDVEHWLRDVGRDRQEGVRRVLREQGFLSMRKGRVPAGTPGGGEFEWTLAFFMEPLPVEERDDLPAKTSARRVKASRHLSAIPTDPGIGNRGAGDSTMPWNSGHGDVPDESAGHTAPGFSGHGAPGHGAPGPGNQGDLPYIEKNYGEKNPPLPPGHDGSETTAGGGQPGGGNSSQQNQEDLDIIVAGFVVLRPDWKLDAIRDALVTSVTRGLGDLGECAVALRELAEGKHGKTTSPKRLYALESGSWWDRVRSQRLKAAAARLAALPRCSKSGHERQSAANCAHCKAEAKVRPEEDRRELDPAAADAAERIMAGTRRGVRPTDIRPAM